MSYVTIFLALLAFSSAYECPLSENFQAVAFSGILEAQPDSSENEQDLLYKNTFDNALAYLPQVALSISGYRSGETKSIQISVSPHQVEKQYFSARVRSPENYKWGLLHIGYLLTTKSDIELGSVTFLPPSSSTSSFQISYKSRLTLQQQTRVIPFISGLQIGTVSSGALTLTYQNYQKVSNQQVVFKFLTEQNVFVKTISLCLALFDNSQPSIQFVSGVFSESPRQTVSTSTLTRNGMDTLQNYLVGFIEFSINRNSAIWIDVSINEIFKLVVDAQDSSKMGVSYFAFSFVGCGSCDGYEHISGNTCSRFCPAGTSSVGGYCIPSNCGSGYTRNGKGECIPQCGQNEYFSGKSCSCDQGFFRIGANCQKCEVGYYYNYKNLACVSYCGENAVYKPETNLCYCVTGYYVINKKCGKCNENQVYNQQTESCDANQSFNCGEGKQLTDFGCQCLPGYTQVPTKGICVRCNGNMQWNANNNRCECLANTVWSNNSQSCVTVQNCGVNERWNGIKCECISGYNLIGGVCKVCPSNSSYNPSIGFCECNSGYTLQNGVCTLSCGANEVLTNNRCNCKPGYERKANGICYQILCPSGYTLNTNTWTCVISCSSNQNLINGRCVCQQGFIDNGKGVCISTTCAPGEKFNFFTYKCESQCGFNERWDPVRNGCASCPINYSWVGDKCICQYNCGSQCPSGSVWNPYTQSCDIQTPTCGSLRIWNGQRCVCKQQYQEINNICVLRCPQNEWEQNGQCVCRPSFTRINGVCVCQVGFLSPTGNCQSCPSNKQWNGFRCVCKAGFSENSAGLCYPVNLNCPNNEINLNGICACVQGTVRVNGFCVPSPCPDGLIWNPNISKCQVNCTPPRIWAQNHCRCPDNYVENNIGICVPGCPPGFELSNGQCIQICDANKNEVARNGKCECTQGHYRNTQNICIPNCPIGQVFVNGRCSVKCDEGEEWTGFVCACQQGYVRIHEKLCLPKCALNQERSPQTGVCLCKSGFTRDSSNNCVPIGCNPGQRFDPQTNTCVLLCPPPHFFNSGANRCACANGFELYNEACVQECSPGYNRNSQGNCVLSCNLNQILVGSECKCKVGYFLINGNCQQCPEFSRKINGACICDATGTQSYGSNCPPPQCQHENMVYNPVSRSCSCSPSYYWVYGKCRLITPCPANEYWTGVSCECQYSYYRVNGKCIDTNKEFYCPDNSVFNGINCQCNSGYFATPNGCQKCPNNQIWNGFQCGPYLFCQSGFTWYNDIQMCIWNGYQCKDNEYWDGSQCRCMPGYFWLNQKVCGTCPAGTIYDGIQCTQYQNNRPCNGPYQYWNGLTCVCIPNFYMVNGRCITCPSGTTWNGYFCQQALGLTRSLNSESIQNANTVSGKIQEKKK